MPEPYTRCDGMAFRRSKKPIRSKNKKEKNRKGYNEVAYNPLGS